MPSPDPTPLAWRRAALVTIGCGVAAGLAFAAAPSAEIWAGFTPGDCGEYCEGSHRCGALATRDALQQPLNTWSNLAFVFVAALAWRRPLRPTVALFAASCALLGVGSFLFHASVTREMQWLDMVGTYAALVAVIARGVAVSWSLAEPIVVTLALAADALFALFKWAISAWIALPLLILAAALPIARWAALGHCSARAALAPLALVVAALLLRQLDVAKVGCSPESLLYQGHALWHVLTAASLGTAFLLFDPAPRS